MGVAVRRGAAGHGNQVGLTFLVQLGRPAGTLPLLEGALQSLIQKALFDTAHCSRSHIQRIGYPYHRPACIGFEQDPSPDNLSERPPPSSSLSALMSSMNL